jgi:hypothetical protein
MKTKETIYTTYDARGRVIKRTSTVEVFDSDEDRRHDDRVHCRCGDLHCASSRRIREAYEDYRMSDQW